MRTESAGLTSITMPVWPFVYGGPLATGTIRSLPEDFNVYEMLPFQPSGEGEHVFLLIEKTGENTEYVARLLARFAGVRQRDIGFAGLKDRHAVTTQWFSVWLPGKADPDWSEFETEQIKVLQAIRHNKKLKRGVLSGNKFNIVVRNWQGDKEKIQEQLAQIQTNGIANYFGEQRFGRDGQNVNKALAMFNGEKVHRNKKSLYLSSARSFLFNQMLAHRVHQGNWNQAIAGDTLIFNKSHSFFNTAQLETENSRRVLQGELHPTAALWGKGESAHTMDALEIEQTILKNNKDLSAGLIANGVEIDYRSLRVFVDDLQWKFIDKQCLFLSFELPVGSYATSVLREIIAQ